MSVNSALIAAVSAIYFDDSSDFASALREVVRGLDPEMAELLENDEAAAFIAVKKLEQ
jgi:hypothetical protein